MNELKMIENELVPVYETSTGEKVVYGTELHTVLGVRSRFNDWVRNRLIDCEALENEDFQALTKNLVNGGQAKEYIIKLDTAKEMAMLERNEKGKQVRRYFIQVEKKYKAGVPKVDCKVDTVAALNALMTCKDDRLPYVVDLLNGTGYSIGTQKVVKKVAPRNIECVFDMVNRLANS